MYFSRKNVRNLCAYHWSNQCNNHLRKRRYVKRSNGRRLEPGTARTCFWSDSFCGVVFGGLVEIIVGSFSLIISGWELFNEIFFKFEQNFVSLAIRYIFLFVYLSWSIVWHFTASVLCTMIHPSIWVSYCNTEPGNIRDEVRKELIPRWRFFFRSNREYE